MLDLMESPASIADFEGTWWFIQAKPGYERRLARELQAVVRIGDEWRGSNVWCPTEKYYRLDEDGRGNRFRRKVERLLFPGYVFVCGSEDDRYRAARSLYSCTVRGIIDQKRFIKQLASFEILANSDEPMSETAPLKEGIRVMVTQGKLVGLTGKVVSLVPSRVAVTIAIDQLPYARATEVPTEFLERM